MSARDDAIEALAKGLKSIADDWGWKGGKPGEVTGGELRNLVTEYNTPSMEIHPYYIPKIKEKALKMAEQIENSSNPEVRDMFERSLRMSFGVGPAGYMPSQIPTHIKVSAVDSLAQVFKELEDADIPREWTGRVVSVMNRIPSTVYPPHIYRMHASGKPRAYIAQLLSDAMRPMTNDQREAFLNLLPRWTGTLEQAANAAKKLYRKPTRPS